MRPHKGGGLDSGISPEFLSDPGDGRVARLAEDARHGLGSGVAWRTRCQGRSRIRDSQIIENHSQAFEQKYAAVGKKQKSSSIKHEKNTEVLDRHPPADEKSRSQRRMTKRDVSAAGAGGHICANWRQSWAAT